MNMAILQTAGFTHNPLPVLAVGQISLFNLLTVLPITRKTLLLKPAKALKAAK